MSKSCFFSKCISELDTRIRGYAVRKSSFSKCISELDIRIRVFWNYCFPALRCFEDFVALVILSITSLVNFATQMMF